MIQQFWSYQPYGFCLKLQVFCGMFSRIAQFADILCDSREQIKQVGSSHQTLMLCFRRACICVRANQEYKHRCSR